VDEHLGDRELGFQPLQLCDVVVVMVGEQDVRDADVALARRLDERLDRAAGVDEEALPLAVADEVGARQPVVVHRPLEDHALRC